MRSFSPDVKAATISSISDTIGKNISVEWDHHEEKRLLRKIDIRCMPALVILFILNFLDVRITMMSHPAVLIHRPQRGNLANARLKGLQTDLNLNDTQYATCISVLFAGYILMQVPSTLIMNAIPKPRLFMATVLCDNFSDLVVCRFFLGFVEAAFYPSAVYYLSRWYTRKEVGFRIAFLNAGNMLAQGERCSSTSPSTVSRLQGLGGLFAAGILGGMENVKGIRGWRWLYIIEGSITVAFGLLLPFILADYPSSTNWLSDRERVIAQGRLVTDVGIIDNPENDEKSGSGIMRGVLMTISDIKVWALAFMYFTYIMGLSFASYMPTITATLGFSTTITLLLTFPPWAFATVYALANSWHSDRTGDKFWHIAGAYGFAILGYIVALTGTAK
ncbi:hypothetical protein HHX47_DHR5000086 [Lentinula edodes]|nr:hypothetical protein HHX47_DHR5000086 [Lentinula edodes]